MSDYDKEIFEEEDDKAVIDVYFVGEFCETPCDDWESCFDCNICNIRTIMEIRVSYGENIFIGTLEKMPIGQQITLNHDDLHSTS